MEIDFYEAVKYGVLKEAMEKQYPMEHNHTKVFDVNGKARESICPRCLGAIMTKENEYPTFCVWCGQKISWSDWNQ